ncbi:MAG: DEAD/DEAH box helicase [Candidatus Riflebacteria bacterium]|nr:DEAD/DEAH box helicase [Candidatus Riflebacteria bacterium]
MFSRSSNDSRSSSRFSPNSAGRGQSSAAATQAPLNTFASTAPDNTPLAKTFAEFGLHHSLTRAISELGFEVPTPIQAQSIPIALQGRDLLACAMTGSGKTAAFLLPIMNRLLESELKTTRVLVMTPTRELAAQIADHLKDLARHTPIRGIAIFGGVGMGPQQTAFQRGVEIIIATPGRLLDHFQYPYSKLPNLDYLVLDEADRMLDMGFLPDIRRVLRHLPATRRQTLFFSATMPAPIVELSREMLRDPIAINIERRAAPATGVSQSLYPVSEELKSQLFLELLKDPKIKNVLAFTRTKHRANRLADFLIRNRIPCDRIHGNRSQGQRTDALAGFKSGRFKVLVATDIAARGIDIEALSHVINFDVPHIVEDYIHRVGRTARAEMVGDALTFVAPAEESDLRQIERHINKSLPRLTLPGFDYRQKAERFEVPLADRIAAIRARKSEERARSRAKSDRKPGGRISMHASPETREHDQKMPSRNRPQSGNSSRSSHGSSHVSAHGSNHGVTRNDAGHTSHASHTSQNSRPTQAANSSQSSTSSNSQNQANLPKPSHPSQNANASHSSTSQHSSHTSQRNDSNRRSENAGAPQRSRSLPPRAF